jgi:MYXO-CTERM domain-containing protein
MSASIPAMPDRQQDDNPHDILAAEEFGIGTRDERHPPDPTGIHEAHDILAAEEFAMPSPADHAEHDSGGSSAARWIPLAAVALVAALLLRRRS